MSHQYLINTNADGHIEYGCTLQLFAAAVPPPVNAKRFQSASYSREIVMQTLTKGFERREGGRAGTINTR